MGRHFLYYRRLLASRCRICRRREAPAEHISPDAGLIICRSLKQLRLNSSPPTLFLYDFVTPALITADFFSFHFNAGDAYNFVTTNYLISSRWNIHSTTAGQFRLYNVNTG